MGISLSNASDWMPFIGLCGRIYLISDYFALFVVLFDFPTVDLAASTVIICF